MHDRIVKSILLTGITISCFYWVCESFMFFFLEPQANFFQHLLGPNMFQTFTRILVLCLFAIFGSHIQYTVNKEREADAALRASEDKYRNIIESIEEGYFETDLRGNLTFFNGALCRILGYEAEELRGKNTRKFTPAETAAATNSVLAGVERTGEPAAVVAYHSACSMQHGQKIRLEPKALLTRAGFAVKDVPEGHICCGSAGVYNILQPEIAGQLRTRKRDNLAKTKAAIVATGNIGCIVQLADRPGETGRPVAHTVELLDWAYGGPEPAGLAGRL